jgi:cellulose synthase/poly-beta-1,6-N-acetylglucosamine synthase-like glycosyltransferase
MSKMQFIDIILSFIFTMLIILHVSWIILLLLPERKNPNGKSPGLSVVIPAYNEEKAIKDTVEGVLDSEYDGGLEVLVVNDGSKDDTGRIVSEIMGANSNVRILETPHVGKANAINEGARACKNEIIVVLDADSILREDALKLISAPFSDERVGGVAGLIRGGLRLNPLTWFQDFEYIQSSAWRHICNKIGATYIFPGFAAFRKRAFEHVGGFSDDTYSEDLDIGLRLKKAGYELRMSRATIYTMVPETFGGLIRQRLRWGRGTIQVLKKHRDMILNTRYGMVGMYGIPTQIYWYFHCFVYIPVFMYQVTEGYLRYFYLKDVIWSWDVFKFFLGWFSVYGVIDYAIKTFQGHYEITLVFILLCVMFTLYLAYNILLLIRFAKPTPRYLMVLAVFFPYALFALLLHTLPSLEQAIRPSQGNIWEKAV